MKLINYKFWYIRRDNDGFIEEAAICFYEIDSNDVIEEGTDIKQNKIIKYKRLKHKDIKHLGIKNIKDSDTTDAVIYDTEDFGRISTDDELRNFLDNLVKKDKRQHIK